MQNAKNILHTIIFIIFWDFFIFYEKFTTDETVGDYYL